MCLNAYGYSLDSPLVKVQRSHFANDNHRHPEYHCRLTYDRIWELLCKGSPLARIAKLAGIHPSWMGDLYYTYFMPFFGNVSAFDRYAAARAGKLKERLDVIPLPDEPWIGAVQEELARLDYPVQPHFVSNYQPASMSVRIFGTVCIGHAVTSYFGGKEHIGVRFSRKTLDRGDFHIVVAMLPERPRSILVLPTKDIAQKLFSDTSQDITRLVISLKRLRSHGTSRCRIRPDEYVSNWPLIRLHAMQHAA